jgi:hypothetical protein
MEFDGGGCGGRDGVGRGILWETSVRVSGRDQGLTFFPFLFLFLFSFSLFLFRTISSAAQLCRQSSGSACFNHLLLFGGRGASTVV